MAWVPFIVAGNRNRYHKNRAARAIIVGLILFFIFGLLMFVFFYRFNGFTIMPIWPMIFGLGGFLIFITIIGVIASLMSAPSNKANEEPIKLYDYQSQEPSQQHNPYKIRNSIQEQPTESIYKEITQEIPIVSEINYCKYCGAKVERDAIFCHQCGTKL